MAICLCLLANIDSRWYNRGMERDKDFETTRARRWAKTALDAGRGAVHFVASLDLNLAEGPLRTSATPTEFLPGEIPDFVPDADEDTQPYA